MCVCKRRLVVEGDEKASGGKNGMLLIGCGELRKRNLVESKV